MNQYQLGTELGKGVAQAAGVTNAYQLISTTPYISLFLFLVLGEVSFEVLIETILMYVQCSTSCKHLK